jgi:nucleotidyltransferase substrate binding protein (TIGR01987 family)
MESREILLEKLEIYQQAISGLEKALQINPDEYNETVADLIKNGRIQKFEYCEELTWKVIKKFLFYFHGIDAKSPKQTIKEFFLLGLIEKADYETLLDALYDRNRLSHIYKEEAFNEIIEKLDAYLAVMQKVARLLNAQIEPLEENLEE